MSVFKIGTLALTAAIGFTGTCDPTTYSDEVWVSNRAEGTISVIDAETDMVIETIEMPNSGEPMYVAHSASAGVVFVGDRANNLLIAFDVDTRTPVGQVEVGAGVFHHWTLPEGDQLWLNNDIDRSTSVIDVHGLSTLATINMPRDLASMDGVDGAAPKPHDVLVSPDGRSAFVSYVGFAGDNDYIVKFDAHTFRETARAAVGKDVHLSATADNNLLYSPCQGSDAVFVLDRESLDIMSTTTIPGAHGAGMANSGDHLYVTNTPGGGDMALFVVDTMSNEAVSNRGVDAPEIGSPHNIALNSDDTKVYVTHSGSTANIVSVFDVSSDNPVPRGVSAEISVGLNPFGLAFVPR